MPSSAKSSRSLALSRSRSRSEKGTVSAAGVAWHQSQDVRDLRHDRQQGEGDDGMGAAARAVALEDRGLVEVKGAKAPIRMFLAYAQ